MIEPTESEGQDELDRFCDAMIAIRREIADIAAGARGPRRQSAEARAAHRRGAVADVDARLFARAGARSRCPGCAAGKYWPPVKRVDNVYGDRNLVCTCAPLEAYAEAAD